MNKRFLKYSIIILSIITIVILIISIIILIALCILIKKEKSEEDMSPEGELIIDKGGELIDNFYEYSTIKSCMNSLLLYARAGNATAVKEISGESYIFEGINIPKEGVLMLYPIHKINNETGSVNFISFKLYKQAPTYYGIVIMDYGNKTFKIIKSTETEYKNAMQKKVEPKYQEYIKVEPQTFNKFKYANISEEETIKQYFRDYIQKALYYPEEAYNSLDEEYRNKRFKTIEDYKNYVQKNRKELESLDIYSMKSSEDFTTDEEYENYLNSFTLKDLDKYLVKDYDNYKMYVCIDDYGNYYIFKITGAMQYTLYLDDYTIELPYFIEKYNTSTAEEKVALNVDKFLKAIKQGDYTYAYEKLSQGFKQNYFKTEQIFIQYSANNLTGFENIDAVKVEKQNDVYVCELKNKTGATKQFVMQLGEKLDFVMSFNIN